MESCFAAAAGVLFTVLLSEINCQTTALPRRPIDVPHVEYTDTTADVSWQHPGGTVQSYIVQYSLLNSRVDDSIWTDPSTMIIPRTQTSVRITGLHPGTRYFVRVATQNDHGVSEFGPLVSFVTDRAPDHEPVSQPVPATLRPTPQQSTTPRSTRGALSPRNTSPTSVNALTQGIGLSLGVFVPILVSCAVFCIVFCLSKRGKVNSSHQNGPLHQFRHPIGRQPEVQLDMRFDANPQSRDEATPPSYHEALSSTEPPSYDSVQEHKDLYTAVSLPPSYPGPPELIHVQLPSFILTEDSTESA